MNIITLQEVELLAALLARAGVTEIEAIWANTTLNRLRLFATGLEAPNHQDDQFDQDDRHDDEPL